MPHLSADNRSRLIDALGEARRIGMLGARPIDEVIDHSLGFVEALPSAVRTVIDLGSGGGDPGLVIAVARPDLQVTLVDRRAKRTDFLARMVGRLNLGDRVEVWEADVADLPQRHPDQRWDAVTCRGFGSPEYTLRLAAPLVAPGGVVLVSEPPNSDGSRWSRVEDVGISLRSVIAGIAVLHRA